MVDFNGELIADEDIRLNIDNRGLKFGDSLFETVKVKNKKVVFAEDHYFRLMASMRMLRMEIAMEFTLEFFIAEILKTVNANDLADARARFTVYRKDGGLYLPKTNAVDFLIEAMPYDYRTKGTYRADLFKDYYQYSGILSTLKTNNKILNTLAAIYARENELDTCFILNERKNLVEAVHSNLFLIKGNTVYTPALSEGCLKGIVRKKIIGLLEKSGDLTLEETAISPFDLLKADEVFITNSITGVQPVTHYRKKVYSTARAAAIQKKLFYLETLG